MVCWREEMELERHDMLVEVVSANFVRLESF